MFTTRLQYFARGVQIYMKQLRATLEGKKGDELKTDEVEICDKPTLLSSVYKALVYRNQYRKYQHSELHRNDKPVQFGHAIRHTCTPTSIRTSRIAEA